MSSQKTAEPISEELKGGERVNTGDLQAEELGLGIFGNEETLDSAPLRD